MGLFRKLFKKKEEEITKPRSFTEKDNKGTRQGTLDQAIAYWSMRNMRQKFDPFVLYTFDNEADSLNAFLELDCIHKAEDTGKLVCTEPLIFGSYRTDNGKYETIIAGENLTHELWQKAKESFEKHEGKRKNDQEPEVGVVPKPEKAEKLFEQVKFIRKYAKGNSFYEEYKSDDTELAKEFLMKKSIDKQQYYVVVETPTGNWGIDTKGLYKERLLPWQNNITSADTEGHVIGIPDSFSLSMAARKVTDNFVVTVKCGNCGHEWQEGIRYQNWTTVTCPKCKKRNKVNSARFRAFFV